MKNILKSSITLAACFGLAGFLTSCTEEGGGTAAPSTEDSTAPATTPADSDAATPAPEGGN